MESMSLYKQITMLQNAIFLKYIMTYIFIWFLQAEVIFLGQLSHPHLVKLIGYCCEDEHRLLVYEYIARGNLDNQLFSSTCILTYELH